MNGKLTMGEHIGGQRFFVGWAQVWASLDRDDALRQRIPTGPHSPNEYRTDQVLRNMPESHAAFGTKPGDGMWLEPGSG